MVDEPTGTGRTRRQLLRGAAIVGGVAWAAPVMQVIAPSASANTSLPCVGCLSGGGLLLQGVCMNSKAAAKIVFSMQPICCPGHAPMKILVICQPKGTKNSDKVYKASPISKPKSIRGFEIYYFDQAGDVGCSKSGLLTSSSNASAGSNPTTSPTSTVPDDGSPIITTKNGKTTVTTSGGQTSRPNGRHSGGPTHDATPCANVFKGTVKDQNNNTLLFDFTDSGDPGKNDIATITVTSPTGTTLVTGTGSLDRGNLKAHPRLGGMKCDCHC